MTTVTLELPERLAAEVQKHRAEMPQVIEWGLAQLRTSQSTSSESLTVHRARVVAERERIIQRLLASGLISSPLPSRRKTKRQRRPPIKIEGKPLSETIIEDRGPR